MKNYQELFAKSSEYSDQWDQKFVELANSKKKKELLEFIENSGAQDLYFKEYKISICINEFTNNTILKEDKQNLIETLKNIKNYVKNAYYQKNDDFKSNEMVVETVMGTVKAITLSDVFPRLKMLYPDIENYARKGKCFEKSYEISLMLRVPNQLVTGYIYGYSDKSDYLHSWIETKLHGREVVIDFTMNAIINKDGYYLIKHAKPLNKILDKDVKSDLELYMSKCDGGDISLIQYLVFRDEMIKDFQSNGNLFQEER